MQDNMAAGFAVELAKTILATTAGHPPINSAYAETVSDFIETAYKRLKTLDAKR